MTVCFFSLNNLWRCSNVIQLQLLHCYAIIMTELCHDCLDFSNDYFDKAAVLIQGSFTREIIISEILISRTLWKTTSTT